MFPNEQDDEYRRQAAEAEKQSKLARNDHDRAAWLRLAQGWLGLVRKRPQSAEEAFDQAVRTKGTGQKQSDASN
jgi:hypothetical protein